MLLTFDELFFDSGKHLSFGWQTTQSVFAQEPSEKISLRKKKIIITIISHRLRIWILYIFPAVRRLFDRTVITRRNKAMTFFKANKIKKFFLKNRIKKKKNRRNNIRDSGRGYYYFFPFLWKITAAFGLRIVIMLYRLYVCCNLCGGAGKAKWIYSRRSVLYNILPFT